MDDAQDTPRNVATTTTTTTTSSDSADAAFSRANSVEPHDESSSPGKTRKTQQPKRTVCDHCRRRRIRCDGKYPCEQCLNAALTCKRDHVPKKRGPKRGHGRVINELRAKDTFPGQLSLEGGGGGGQGSQDNPTEYVRRRLSAACPPLSLDPSMGDSSANPSAAPSAANSPPQFWASLTSNPGHNVPEPRSAFSSDDYRPNSRSYLYMVPQCVELYYEHIYPIMPLLYMPAIRQTIARPMTPSEKNLIYALCALTSMHMSGKSIEAPGPPSWEVAGRFFLDECISVRQSYDFLEDLSLSAVISSFYLSTSFFEINQSRKSWHYLREALNNAQDLGLQNDSTAATFVALQNLLALPPIFLRPRSPTSLFAGSTDPSTPEPTDIQKADLLVTQQWLRLIVWQSSMRQQLLSWTNPADAPDPNASPNSMCFSFPLSVARDTAAILASLPPKAVEVHGMGIMEKIFEIGTWCVNVLGACESVGFAPGGMDLTAGDLGVLNTGRRSSSKDPIEFFVRTLSASPNSRVQFAEKLLKAAGENPGCMRVALSPGVGGGLGEVPPNWRGEVLGEVVDEGVTLKEEEIMVAAGMGELDLASAVDVPSMELGIMPVDMAAAAAAAAAGGLRGDSSYDFLEDLSLSAVISSFYLSTSFFEINQSRKSWHYLREALNNAQDLGLQNDSTYYGLSPEDTLCRQRVFWILFVTERSFAILRNKPITFKQTPSLPSTRHSYESPDIHAGFLQLVSSYTPLDESFVTAWNEGSDPRVSAATFVALQNLLALPPIFLRPRSPTSLFASSTDPSTPEPTDIQKADLLVTQQWLRLIVWQSSMRQQLLSWTNPADAPDPNAPPNSMCFSFPLSVARDTAAILASLPPKAVEVHGMGIMEKIFEIGTWCVNVLGACESVGFAPGGMDLTAGDLGVLNTGRRSSSKDPIEFFVRTLSASPNSRVQFAEKLLKAAGENPGCMRVALSPGVGGGLGEVPPNWRGEVLGEVVDEGVTLKEEKMMVAAGMGELDLANAVDVPSMGLGIMPVDMAAAAAAAAAAATAGGLRGDSVDLTSPLTMTTSHSYSDMASAMGMTGLSDWSEWSPGTGGGDEAAAFAAEDGTGLAHVVSRSSAGDGNENGYVQDDGRGRGHHGLVGVW
ncbi:hypothetical protein BN1708_006845 [Verticillium longisporum]|uniref:Zn(2)-C6 fungal-type domain-containing protein n=2 Tax=Verticillium longisporum TaxID=100787 RepID=A0A0G4MP36_VERLO|nr:hypothetical protein BN1708_006845 [Verticillium longisporum]